MIACVADGGAFIPIHGGNSPPHLHLLFRRHMNTSPVQFLLRQRLLKAQHLLTNGDMSVKQVCYAAGFRVFPYFCARFRRKTGMTPTAYRRRFADAG